MKSRLSKHDLLLLYGVAWVLGPAITVLITIILSTFSNYRIIIVTNNFNECYIEIVGVATGIIIFVYELIRRIRIKEGD